MRRGRDTPAARLALVLGAFTLGLLSRWGFQLNVYWGETTAPSVILIGGMTVAGLTSRLVPLLTKRMGLPTSYAVSTWTTATFLVLYIYAASAGFTFYYAQIDYPIRSARGEIYARRPHGPVVARTLERLAALPRAAELLVLPEEGFINFLSGRRSRVRNSTLIPGMLMGAEDENRFVAQLEEDGPQYVIVTGRRYREFGLQGLASYNPLVVSWIENHYARLDHIQEGNYAVDVYERPAAQATRRAPE